jgi:hypothetical protein
MATGVNRNTLAARRETDLARAISQPAKEDPVAFDLFVVTGATEIGTGNYRWKYNLVRARVGNASTYNPGTSSNTFVETGLSASELSNGSIAYYSYGVQAANVPTGWAPKQIPVGSYVVAVPHRTLDGTLVWIIIANQAIDGTC